MEGVRQRKREMVDGMIAIHRKRFAVPNLEFLLAEGRLVAPRTVEATFPDGGTEALRCRAAVPESGNARVDPAVSRASPTPRRSRTSRRLELGRLPGHLIVLGGGYVGVELAQAFRRLGSDVTVLESGAQLLGREDPDVADAVREIFEEDGIDVVLGCARRRSWRAGPATTCACGWRPAGASRRSKASDILVAAGRTPNTRDIGLEDAGIELDARGFIKVDERLQTTAPDVWAMGECAGSPQFTHVAFDDFRVVRDNLAGKRALDSWPGRSVLRLHDPALARIGLDETTAKQRGIEVRVARLPMTSVLRARAIGETRGFMKMLIDRERATASSASRCSAPTRARCSPSSRPRCSAACPTRSFATRSSPTRRWPRASTSC